MRIHPGTATKLAILPFQRNSSSWPAQPAEPSENPSDYRLTHKKPGRTIQRGGSLGLVWSQGGPCGPSEVNSGFGEGVNPRLRKIRGALAELGLPQDELLEHGTPPAGLWRATIAQHA